MFSILCIILRQQPTWICCSLFNSTSLLSLFLLCSIHHGCWTAGLSIWTQFITSQVLLWGLWHLLCWRVSDRLGLHAGHCRSHADCLLAFFCKICTKGAAVPHPFTHTVIVHWYCVLFFPLPTTLLTWTGCHRDIPLWRAMLFGKPHSVITQLTLNNKHRLPASVMWLIQIQLI